jgi:hypothetical protein
VPPLQDPAAHSVPFGIAVEQAPLLHTLNVHGFASAGHGVSLGEKALAGHAAVAPLQFSAGSQGPVLVRQTVATLRSVSAGQSGDAPEQFSAMSHTPAEIRQTVVFV